MDYTSSHIFSLERTDMLTLQSISKAIKNNMPTILTAAGVVGVVSTAVLAGKATLEASSLIEKSKKEFEEQDSEYAFDIREVKPKTLIRTFGPIYAPVVIMGGITIACVIGAHTTNIRRQAAIMSMYSFAEKSLNEYKDKVIETIGENKERKIRESIDQDHVDANPVSTTIVFGAGSVLCFDTMSGRYFNSDMETLRKAQNDINSKIIDEMYASLNEFYNKIGLDNTALGEEVGWNLDRRLDIDFSTMLSDDNRPCIVLNYRVLPQNNYGSLH